MLGTVAAELVGLAGPAPKTVAPFELVVFRTDELVLQIQLLLLTFIPKQVDRTMNIINSNSINLVVGYWQLPEPAITNKIKISLAAPFEKYHPILCYVMLCLSLGMQYLNERPYITLNFMTRKGTFLNESFHMQVQVFYLACWFQSKGWYFIPQ